MKTVYKINLTIWLKEQGKDILDIALPVLSKPISVANQREEMVMYFECENKWQDMDNYKIAIVGTGHEIKFNLDTAKFLGTISLAAGNLIFHVYWVE